MREPSWKNDIAKRLAGLRLPPEREAEITEELSGHLTDDYRRLVASGANEAEAREIALEGLNESPQLAEKLRRVERMATRSAVVMGAPQASLAGDLWRDLCYTMRTLQRSPGFAALAVFSLALGIGGNTAMFRIVSAALIRPLPYADPERLVQGAQSGYFPPGGLVYLQEHSRTMEVAGYNPAVELNLTGVGQPWRVKGSAVSANLFQVLRTSLELGRAFRPGEDEAGRDGVVILSHEMWQDRFGGDPRILGRMVMLGGLGREVVGIAPRGFAFPDATARFWVPLHMDPRDASGYWAQGFMPVMARLRGRASLTQAQHEMGSLSLQMLSAFPYPMGRDWAATMTVVPLRQFLTADIRVKLLVLQCAVGLVLLIACANVAGLLLARTASRQKEIALRVALGASRARIVRQVLTESVVLAMAGGALGVALALAAGSALQMALPAAPGGVPAEQGWTVLAFAAGLSLITGLVFGSAPALVACRQDLALAIRTGGQRSASTARNHVRSALVVGEVALAAVLTISAGLLIRSLWNLSQVNPGFQPQHVLTLRVSPDETLCKRREACIALYGELARQVRNMSGVQDAAMTNALPLGASIPASAVKIEGVPYAPAERAAPMFWAGAVTPDYFRVMDVPILRGRALEEDDGEKSEPVIVVSAATARRYWSGEDPIGKHVQLIWENNWRKVVGVAGDVRQFDLAGRSPDFIRGVMYMPYSQAVDNDRQLPAVMTLIVRTTADAARIAGGVRELVARMNPDVPVDEIRGMVSLVEESTRQPRSMMWLFTGFAAVALVLASVGAYGVVSHTAAQRTFEIGVRMALGARRSSILAMVLSQSLRLVMAGLAIGLGASRLLTRLLATFLYGTAATDPLTLAAVASLLTAVALVAGYVPARRAASIDPLQALRAD